MLNNDIEFDHVSAHTLEQLRLIRNECRLFMTNNQKEISVTQQEKWFNELTEDVMPFLVINSDKFIGYAVIKIDGNETLLTGGLIESFRGQGYGRIIFQKLIDLSIEINKIPTLNVLKNNERAIKLYSSLGFKVINENDKIYIMRFEK